MKISISGFLGRIFLILAMCALPAAATSSLQWDGFWQVSVDGRRGQNSPEIRQDWDVASDFDLHTDPAANLSVALSGRVTSDIDGRRPGAEPGIYNGIQETFQDKTQPYLYRAYGNWNTERSIGVVEDIRLRLGRQYRVEGDALWFDGAEVGGDVAVKDKTLNLGVFGGVPVRLYESATDDWLLGGYAGFTLGRAAVKLEAYHVDEKARFGFIRRDNVARASVASPVGQHANVFANARWIDAEGVDLRARGAWNPGGAKYQLRADYRYQSEDRGAQSTEVDLASVVLGRAVGAPRRAYQEYGAALAAPLGEKFHADVGLTTREDLSVRDRNNYSFDRYYGTLSFSDVGFARRAWDGSVTLEAYETPTDWTRAVTGALGLKLGRTLRASAGTSYAVYSYDYTTGVIRDDVRTGTASLEWRPTAKNRFDLRYDIENDDQRLHHYLKAAFRRDF